MCLLNAPAAPGGRRRKRAPLDLLVLVDTSGSTDEARATQVTFVEALLGSLCERDTFALATCDTEVRWAFKAPVRSSPANLEMALFNGKLGS